MAGADVYHLSDYMIDKARREARAFEAVCLYNSGIDPFRSNADKTVAEFTGAFEEAVRPKGVLRRLCQGVDLEAAAQRVKNRYPYPDPDPADLPDWPAWQEMMRDQPV